MLRLLFRFLRLRGDARAITRGRYPQRVARRHAHRALNRALRKAEL